LVGPSADDIGSPTDGVESPGTIGERLRVLADLMVLIVLHGEPSLASRRISDERGPATVAGCADNQIDDATAIRRDHRRQPVAAGGHMRVMDVAPTDASIVLLGETGTGKGLFARAVLSEAAAAVIHSCG